MMQTTNVGLTSHGASAGMMNEGRHHHGQNQNPGGNFKNCSNTSQQHCCCFGGGGGATNSYHGPAAQPPQQQQQYQDQHRGSHVASTASNSTTNLAYYQTYTPVQQNTWYNNNEYEHYANNLYDWNQDWNTQNSAAANTTTNAGVLVSKADETTGNTSITAASTDSVTTSKSTATSPMWSSNDQYDYYSSYPTPPTPAGSTVSGGDCPPSVAPSMQSIPSDHYPPTPYSVDLNSPTSSHVDCHYSTTTGTSNNQYGFDSSGKEAYNATTLETNKQTTSNNQANSSNMGYVQNPSVSANPSSSPNRSSSNNNNRIDIPLHELIGAAEAVEADLLESLHVGGHSAQVSPSPAAAAAAALAAAAAAASTPEAVQKKAEETASTASTASEQAGAVSNKPKNMASSTCSTSSSINSSCWKAESQHGCHSLSPCPIQVERQTSPSSEIAVQTSAAAAPLSPYFTAAGGATVAGTSANIASDGKIFYGPLTGPFGAAGRLMESSHSANSGNPGTTAPASSVKAKEALTKRYDPEQLQRCLSDACLDWFTGSAISPTAAAAAAASPNSTSTRPLGYPFNRLKRTRSPSPPCLDSSYNADSGSWSSDCDSESSTACPTSLGPPRLEMQQPNKKKVKTIRLTFDGKYPKSSRCSASTAGQKSAEKQKQLEKQRQQQSNTIANSKFTFSCSCCYQSWPLCQDNIDSISHHLSLSGTAPLLKPNRVAFSQFFQHFSYKVRLLVNPKNATVSTKTVLTCNYCDKIDFNLPEINQKSQNESAMTSDLSFQLHDHMEACHPALISRNFCYFCDRKVADLTRHMDEYFSIHHSRLLALATCYHIGPKSDKIDSDYSEEICVESECKKCGDIYQPDPRLPDWVARATCNKCLTWCLKIVDSPSPPKPKVILCQYCRQGKFGFTKTCQTMSISICVNCSKMAQAFQKMTDTSQCRSYVTGMLNELLKQLGHSPPEKKADEPKATFSLRQLLLSSVLDNKKSPKEVQKMPEERPKLTKFQSFTLHNMKTIEAVSAMEEENDEKCNILTGKTQKNVALFCSKCDQSFPTWSQVAAHVIQDSGSFSKHLSKSLDQCLVIYSTTTTTNNSNADSSKQEQTNSKTSLTSVLRCRKCKFYLPTNSDRQLENVLSHVHECVQTSADASAGPLEEKRAGHSCAVCGGPSGHPEKDCLNYLKTSLALYCNPCMVCKNMAVNPLKQCEKHTKISRDQKLGKCLSIITNAFDRENHQDSIEELIVASKQISKRQHNNNSYYY